MASGTPDDAGGAPQPQHRIAVGTPPCFLYYYRETRRAQDPAGVLRYRMEAILPCGEEEEVGEGGAGYRWCHSHSIERSALHASDLVHLRLFNSICIPESNARTMRFTFATLHHGAYTYGVTPAGQLTVVRYEAAAPTYDASVALMPSSTPSGGDHHGVVANNDDDTDELDTFHAASVYTLTHDYIQTSTPGRNVHVGASFVPCGTLFIPMWLGESGMRALLAQWYEQKLPVARTEALVTVRLLGGGSSIRHVVPRLREKHQHVAA